MKKRFKVKLTFAVLVFFLSVFAEAQEKKPLIQISSFVMEGISGEESRLIKSLIQSYFSDFGNVVSDGGLSFDGTASADWGESPDYVVQSSVLLRNDTRFFTLEIHSTLNRETAKSTTSHKTTSDLILKARSLVESVFAAGSSPAKTGQEEDPSRAFREETARPERITETALTGVWRGEKGIELFRLFRGGKGIAIFSSGAQMNLTYTIENNVLKIRQASGNMERYYYHLPYKAAKLLTAEAEPMRWELFLGENGTKLRGRRIFTGVILDGNEVKEIISGSVMDTEWLKGH